MESHEWEIINKRVIALKTEGMSQLFLQSFIWRELSSVIWGVESQLLEIWNVIVL